MFFQKIDIIKWFVFQHFSDNVIHDIRNGI